MTIFINREQLHQQVWKMPMTKLAPIYGVKNYGLKKICDRFLIPTPKSGYWSKLSFGKAEDITPLPLWKSCMLCYIQYQTKTLATMMFPKKVDISAAIYKPTNVVELIPNKVNYGIVVKKNLSNLHPLLQRTRNELEKSKPGEHGRILPSKNGVAIYVSRENVKRALLIMDAIFKWCENQNYRIKKPFERDSRTFITIDGIDIEIQLFEKSNVSGKIKSAWGYEYNQYKPSGNITLQVNSYTNDAQIRKNWSDGKTQKVEELLNSFVESALAIVSWKKKENDRFEQERLKWHEQRIEKIYQEQCTQYEGQQLAKLIQESNDLDTSEKIRKYIHAVQEKAKNDLNINSFPIELQRWLEWATEEANKIDPLNGKWPSYISAKVLFDKSTIQ